MPTKVRIVEEPLAPEGREERRLGVGLCQRPLTSICILTTTNLLRDSWRTSLPLLPSPALPPSPPTSGFPRLAPKLCSAANEAPVKKLLSLRQTECPSSSSLPETRGLPTTPPCQNHPFSAKGVPQGRFTSPGLGLCLHPGQTSLSKGVGDPARA